MRCVGRLFTKRSLGSGWPRFGLAEREDVLRFPFSSRSLGR